MTRRGSDPDWGTLIWLTMTTGARRGELCGLRWSHVDLVPGCRRSGEPSRRTGGTVRRRTPRPTSSGGSSLDPETVKVLREHRERCRRARPPSASSSPADAFVFSLAPDGRRNSSPSSVTQRYSRLAARLGIETQLHKLRHYSATELIAAGRGRARRWPAGWARRGRNHDAAGLRGVGGRGGPARRRRLLACMPGRPAAEPAVPRALRSPRTPRERIALALYARIVASEFSVGAHLPAIKELAAEHEVAASTVHRAFELLRGTGASSPVPRAGARRCARRIPVYLPDEPAESAAPQDGGRRMLEFRLRTGGSRRPWHSALRPTPTAPRTSDNCCAGRCVAGSAGRDAEVGDYELIVMADGAAMRTFVMIG